MTPRDLTPLPAASRDDTASSPPAPARRGRHHGAGRAIGLAVRVSGSAVAFAWLAFHVDGAALWTALTRIPATAVITAAALVAAGMALGGIRWWVLLMACRPPRPPSAGWVARWYLIGVFYNTCVPGGVGGDVVRGVALRDALSDDPAVGTARGLALGATDRICGLIGLVLVLSVTTTLWPVAGLQDLRPVAGLFLVGALTALGGLASVGWLAARLPAALARPLVALPTLARPGYVLAAVVLSLGTQLAVAATGWVLVASLVPGSPLNDALVVVPVAAATAFLPVSVGGAGVREAAFATLYGAVGVGEPEAYAASLAMFGVILALVLPAGLLTLVPEG